MVNNMARHKGLSFCQKKKKISSNTIREIFGWIFGVFTAIFLAFVVVFSVGMNTGVIGVSMEPTLYNGQEILINRFVYNLSSPKRGDVIVFLPNNNQNTHYYVKRVVGLPGETVQIKSGRVYIDGVLYEDKFDKIADPGIAENEIKLGTDEYFVLGDNRNNSEDSRSGNVGLVTKDTIIGKAWLHMAKEESGIDFIK